MPRSSTKSLTNELDELLFNILSSVAAILVSTGYGFSRVNELAKMAFVEAARAVDPDSGAKLSIARIAALTGITRTDVSRIIRSQKGKALSLGKPTSRVERVAIGWATDKTFRSKNQRPQDLQFAGSRTSFTALVRRYSGDIPPKAMLKEMMRLGMVQLGQRGQLSLTRTNVAKSRRTTTALKAVIPWIGFLARASTTNVNNDLTSLYGKFELKFSSLPQVYAAMRELQGRHRAFVTALEQLGNQENGKGRYALNLSVAVAATNPRATGAKASSSRSSKQIRAKK